MAALFPRIKVWIANETITAAQLNGEFNNILNNLGLATIGPYSTSVPLFQETFDPGNLGTENLPSTSMEEIQANRYMIQAITGESQWYIPPGENLATLSIAIGSSFARNRVVSGAVDANGQVQYLVAPGGSSFLLGLNASPTPLQYTVNAVQLSISADATLDLSGAPGPSGAASEATYLNDRSGPITKILGEKMDTVIYVDSVGAGWTAREGMLSAFKFTNSTNEYFIGVYRDNGVDQYIEKCLRGYLFDSSLLNGRLELAASEVISILNISYIFAKADGTIFRNTSNNEPVVSGVQPASSSNGDLWFDLVNQKWMLYNGISYGDAEATLIGIAACSSTACEAARSIDPFAAYSPLCDISLKTYDGGIVKNAAPGGQVSVYGTILNYLYGQMSWDMTTDLDTGIVEAAETMYYMYITNGFALKISNIEPHDRQQDLKGFYHPSKPWRCIGLVYNDITNAFVSQAQTLGPEKYLARGSVSTESLRPYTGYDFPGGLTSQGVLNQYVTEEVALVNTGTTSPVTVTTTGRMLEVEIFAQQSGDRILCTGASTAVLALEYKRSVDSSYSRLRTFNIITAGDLTIPTALKASATVPAGTYNIRLDLVTSGGAVSVFGTLQAWES